MTPDPAIMRSVEQLGYKVTVGDVATQLGLNVAQANQGLIALASDAGGHLQVAESGDIVYLFPHNFRAVLRNKYLQLQLEELWQKIWRVLFYLIRVSFGIILIASIVLILITIYYILSSSNSNRNGSSRGGGSRGASFFYFPDLFWYFSPGYRDRYQERRVKQGENSSLNFLEAIFSFLFGDGNPNARLEERRWQEIGGVIRQNGGAVVAEQVTPYLDNLGETYQQEYEDYMLPILVRFNGQPKVSEAGEIVYCFPELQVTANQKRNYTVSEYLHEAHWRFSMASSQQNVLSAGLGVLNLILALFLGSLLKNGTLVTHNHIEFITFVRGIYWLILAYGTGFLGIPLVRYFWLQRINRQIAQRNSDRLERARLLANASPSLQNKITYAHQFAQEKLISEEDVIYSTKEDLLEQEFKGEK
jgi:hypothetical protein